MAKQQSKKSSQAKGQAPTASAEPKLQESRAVLAIRIPLGARDRIRAVAGWGRQQEWVFETLMKAVEAAEKK